MKFLRDTIDVTCSICDLFVVKFAISSAYAVYSFLFDVAKNEVMLGVLVLIIFDFITGIYASKVSGEQITSAGVFRSAIKVAVYFLLISAGHVAQATVPVLNFIENTIIGFLALTELISIIENTGKMGYAIPRALLNRLQEIRDKK